MARRHKTPDTKLHPVSTTLSAAHLGEVKAIAAARHVPPAAIIREAVEAWLAGRPGPQRSTVPQESL